MQVAMMPQQVMSPPLDFVLERLSGVKRSGSGFVACCPAHEDRRQSLSVSEGDDGRVLLHCHAGCDPAAVCASLGMTPADLFEKSGNGHTDRTIVATYDYVDESGELLFQVVRFGPKDFRQRRPDGRGGWTWKLGDGRRVLYRLPQVLEAAHSGGTVHVVEGEKDVHALERAGAVATTGAGGAGKWHPSYSESLSGAHVVIVADKDEPGRRHAAAVAASLAGVAASVVTVEAATGKDAADHLAAGHGLDEFVTVPAEALVSIPQGGTATVQPVEAPELASCPDILAAFAAVVIGRGVVGEERFAKVVYLALTSRVLPRPVSIAAKGPSSAGKSFTVEQVVGFFPAAAYYALSSMSEHALAYSQEPLAHRFLILYEAAGLESDFASYLLRSLLSEGCIRYETVEKMKGKGLVPRLIEREGPTGLIVTTTQVSLHPENETRLLSVPANDTAEQTKNVIRMLACEEGTGTGDADLAEWRQLQEWIAQQDNRVAVPFAVDLAELVPPVAVRLRRDFTTVLSLIKTHAILHQQTRTRDDAGRIVATVGDYSAIRALVADLVADEVGATVPQTTVETVQAVAGLVGEHESRITYLQLGERLNLDRSAAMRRAKVAVSRGYLKNLETRRGQPAKLVIGEPLPGDVTILPQPADVAAAFDARTGCTVAGANGGRDTTPSPDLEALTA